MGGRGRVRGAWRSRARTETTTASESAGVPLDVQLAVGKAAGSAARRAGVVRKHGATRTARYLRVPGSARKQQHRESWGGSLGGNPQKNGQWCRVLRYHNLPSTPTTGRRHRRTPPVVRGRRDLSRGSQPSPSPPRDPPLRRREETHPRRATMTTKTAESPRSTTPRVPSPPQPRRTSNGSLDKDITIYKPTPSPSPPPCPAATRLRTS